MYWGHLNETDRLRAIGARVAELLGAALQGLARGDVVWFCGYMQRVQMWLDH